MRLRALRRLPVAFGWLTMRRDAATAGWMKSVLAAREPPRRRAHPATAFADRHLLFIAAERQPDVTQPCVVVWASRDRVMPGEHGRRLAELLPHGRPVEVQDSYTLIPLVQPTKLAEVIREFALASEAT